MRGELFCSVLCVLTGQIFWLQQHIVVHSQHLSIEVIILWDESGFLGMLHSRLPARGAGREPILPRAGWARSSGMAEWAADCFPTCPQVSSMVMWCAACQHKTAKAQGRPPCSVLQQSTHRAPGEAAKKGPVEKLARNPLADAISLYRAVKAHFVFCEFPWE